MSELRDYVSWHKAYDDPNSGLSWRLRVVQQYLADAFDRHHGELRLLSLCSGDGRDLLGVLSERPDAERVRATLIELHPGIAARARDAAASAGLSGVEVRVADAGNSASYAGAVPADVVMLIGIFGNISDSDIKQTVRAAPQLCQSGATLVWSRGRDRDDRNDAIRAWFRDAGFEELDYATREVDSGPALGAMRYPGAPRELIAGEQLFTFLR